MSSRMDTVIETRRLVLKVPSLKEFEPWCAFMGDEDAARYIGKAQPPSVVWRNICSIVGAWHEEGFAMFSVFEKATGRWVGRLGPWRPYQWPGNEVGWGLIRETWGKGYAFEGSVAAMDFAVDVVRCPCTASAIPRWPSSPQAPASEVVTITYKSAKSIIMAVPHDE